ncbi:MurR/RpiR family transcriptional regulator [Peribacillus sp. SCS-155]|uniref:MurR/RpiR family transcriptional regulator n=1 Tax=Peribacillus sedimenti TaxID=3115297 RepID=UPI0039059ED2
MNTTTINLLSEIRSLYPNLTKTEQKVANIVLEEAQGVMYGSITDLAEKAEVGETSVLRFCRRIHYKGFQDFKIALAQSISSQAEPLVEEVNIIQSLARKNMELIQDATRLLKESELRRAVEFITKANRILLFGVGSSGSTAQNAHYRFIRLGLPVESITDSHLGSVKAALLGTNDVMIVISVSGSTVDTVDVAQAAKKNGATVICITGHGKSPAAKEADILFLSPSRVKPTEGSSFSSIISQLHILDILFQSVSEQMGNEAERMMEWTAKASSRKLY